MKLIIKQSNDVVSVDVLTWFFNLFKGPNKTPCIHSRSYGFSAFRMSDYWVELGRREILIEMVTGKNKVITSYSLEELASKVALLEHGQSTTLVVYNFDIAQLGRIKDRLPGIDPRVFDNDVIFIPCTNLDKAKKLKASLPSELAYTFIVDRGIAYMEYQ